MKYMLHDQLNELQEIIGYHFKDEDLLVMALTHSSYTNENNQSKHKCNERIEFLGDAVLELITSEFLFQTHKNMSEGVLTKRRASIVCEPSLASCARDISLGKYLLLGRTEEVTGGRKKDSLLSDAIEALIGAIYLDGGFTNVKEFVKRFVLNDLENKHLFYDSKTILQELVQAHFTEKLSYRQISEEGPEHNKTFTTEVLIGTQSYGCGVGKTKKGAEQDAAYKAILKLRKNIIK